MGKCARRAKSIGRVVGKALTPIGVRLIGDIVGQIAGADLADKAKAEAAFAAAKVSLRQAGIDARDHMIRLTMEYAVAALKQGEAALADLGQMDDDDLTDEPA